MSGLLETVSEVCSVASVSARHSNFVGMPKSLRAELERKIWRIFQQERLRKVIGDAKRASENLAAVIDDAISSASKKE